MKGLLDGFRGEHAVSEMPRLAIILGAGASFDCCPPDRPDLTKQGDWDWQPPIVSNLLESKEFNKFLNTHLNAADIFNDIRMEVSREVPFEKALRSRWESDNEHIRYKMRFVPIALQQFFWRASEAYTNQPANYVALVSQTVGRGITTAFVTMNYDTILDKVLCRFRAGPHDSSLRTMGSYFSSPDWLLVKLHGSADWGYRVGDAAVSIEGVLAAQELRPFAREEIEVLSLPGDLREGRTLFYPALALPVEGKYGFVCPISHEDALVTYLQDCDNFLFVGFSARDSDLLECLSANVRGVRRLWIVTGPDDLDDVKERLRSIGPFRRNPMSRQPEHTYTSFTDFARRGLSDLTGYILSDKG